MVTEDGRTVGLLAGRAQVVGEVLAVKDVVTQDQAARILTDELFADDERLCQTVRCRLFSISQLNTVLAAIAQQFTEAWQVFWCRDDQDFTHPRQHQH